MPFEIDLISLRCNDAQEKTDEPYLLVNGHREWGPVGMRTNSSRAIGRHAIFNHDVRVELRESDRRSVPHRKDDRIGTMHISEAEVRGLIRGDRHRLTHTFHRDRGITGDASYTLEYDLREA